LTEGTIMERQRAVALADEGGKSPTIALALGGGGARGLAHILMLEAFDELGIRPKIIAGTSIGAIFAAAYASGLSGREIRVHTEEVLTNRFWLLRDLFSARAQRGVALRNLFYARNALLEPSALLDIVLPSRVAHAFADLDIPLKIVASDYYGLEAAVLEQGSLRRAVAASMALPVIFEPVIIDGRTLIDGGLTNPLPFDILEGEADILVAIDVSGTTVPSEKRPRPTALEALFASSFLFERSIVREKLKSSQPDIYIDAGTGRFQVLDFLRVREVLAAALPAKEKLKAKLARVLGAETLPAPPALQALAAPSGEEEGRRPRRRLLKLRRRGPKGGN
jgi:NTE family protein